MNFEVLVTENFKKEIKKIFKKHSSIKKDIEKLIVDLEKDAFLGTSLGKNCYKIRVKISSKAAGKSGGARVITLVKIMDLKIFLLDIYDKSQQDSISDQKLQKLITQLEF